MMKKTDVLLAILGISLFLSVLTPTIQAAPTYTPGVSANQVATYIYSGTLPYNSPTVIHFRSVTGSNAIYRRDNGTTDIPIDVSDILSYNPWWCVSTGMVFGDRFQADNPNYVVDAVVSKNYAGQTWTAIQMNSSVSLTYINALFDQSTGLMLYFEYTQSSIHMTFVLQSLGTETVPGIPIDNTMVVLMVVAGLGAAVLLVSRKVNVRTKTP